MISDRDRCRTPDTDGCNGRGVVDYDVWEEKGAVDCEVCMFLCLSEWNSWERLERCLGGLLVCECMST